MSRCCTYLAALLTLQATALVQTAPTAAEGLTLLGRMREAGPSGTWLSVSYKFSFLKEDNRVSLPATKQEQLAYILVELEAMRMQLMEVQLIKVLMVLDIGIIIVLYLMIKD